MIKNYDELEYIAHVTGKPVLVIFNHINEEYFYYLIDDFRPALPSNYVYDCFLKGKLINNILKGVNSFSASQFNIAENTSVLAKIDELPTKSFVWKDNFMWIKIL